MDTKFRVGSVISKSFSVWGRNILTFGVLYIVGMIPAMVFFGLSGVGSASSELALGQVWEPSGTETLFLLIGSLFLILGIGITFGGSALGAVQALQGHRPKIADCIKHGLSVLLPVALVYFLFSILLSLGLILLIIPAFFVVAIYGVCVPVTSVERPGIFAAFSRSGQLTKGNRWRIIGVLFVFGAIIMAVYLLFALLAALIAFVAGDASIFILSPFYIILTVALGSLMAVLYGVIYYDLRIEKEGMDVSKAAAVFE